MNEEKIDFSRRFQEEPACVHDNICGTKKELLEHFETTIVGNRTLALSDGLELEKQLKEIAKAYPPDGVVAFLFESADGNVLETQRVFVQAKRRKKS